MRRASAWSRIHPFPSSAVSCRGRRRLHEPCAQGIHQMAERHGQVSQFSFAEKGPSRGSGNLHASQNLGGAGYPLSCCLIFAESMLFYHLIDGTAGFEYLPCSNYCFVELGQFSGGIDDILPVSAAFPEVGHRHASPIRPCLRGSSQRIFGLASGSEDFVLRR